MKYVSWMKMSTGVEAMKMPLRPPMTKLETNPGANSIGLLKRMSPPHRVPSQLKVLIADGTAMTMVDSINAVPRTGFMPLMNMWCPHTIHDKKAKAIIENAIAR